MKKILFVVSLITLLISCKKEVSDMQTNYFVRFYGDALDDVAADIELTSDGGYVVAATTQRPSRADTDIMLFTTDKYGFQNSETVYCGTLVGKDTLNHYCTGLLVLDDGYVVSGYFNSGGNESTDSLFLVKFRKDLTEEWRIPNDPSFYDRTGQLNDVALVNNQIVVTGFTLQGGTKKPLYCIFGLNGVKSAWKSPTSNPGDYYTGLAAKDNGFVGFGTMVKNAPNTNFFVRDIGEQIPFDLYYTETSSKIIQANNGGFFFVGTIDPIGSGYSQILVKKINNDYSLDTTFAPNPFGLDADFRGVDIQEMEDGRVAVLGDKTLSKDTDIVLFILNPDGTSHSSKIYGKTGVQSAVTLKSTPEGGLIILGNNQQEKTSGMITLIKTDGEGNIWE